MRLLLSAVSAIWLRLRTEKSFASPGRIAVAAREDFGHLADRRLHLRRARRLHVDLVHEAGQPLLEVVGVGRRRIDPVERDLLLARRGDAEHLALARS